MQNSYNESKLYGSAVNNVDKYKQIIKGVSGRRIKLKGIRPAAYYSHLSGFRVRHNKSHTLFDQSNMKMMISEGIDKTDKILNK